MQQDSASIVHQNLHYILSNLVPLFEEDDSSTPEMFTPLPSSTSILRPSSYKVAFQNVWLTHLRHPLDSSELRNLLLIIHKRIIPYMNKPQLLMDWLTDAYNSGLLYHLRSKIRWQHISTRAEWFMGIDAETQP
jgi:U3 small nucleolar RNA-associated protein 19